MDLLSWTILLHFVVGAGYMSFALLVFVFGFQVLKFLWPESSGLKVLSILSVIGTFIFLVGCGEHHLHLGHYIWENPELFDEHFIRHMFWDSLVQALGVWGPIPLILLVRSAMIRMMRKKR